MEQEIEVVHWHTPAVSAHHDLVWAAWLHGEVAGVRDGHRLLLVVPMDEVTPTGAALAFRLFHVGAWREAPALGGTGEPAVGPVSTVA